MTYSISRILKPFICILPFFSSVSGNAQVSLLQNTIDKLESHQNFSYRSVNKKKELFTGDTTIEKGNAVFEKSTRDKNAGYLFNIETQTEQDNFIHTDRYNGHNLININPGDSTYTMQDIRSFNMMTTLPGCLKWMQDRLEKRSSKKVITGDTTIHGINSYYLIADVYDTIINKELNYTYAYLYIDKLSGMPSAIIIKSRNTTFGDGVSNYYSESRYFDYKFDQDNIAIASSTIPKGFNPPKEPAVLTKEQTDLLASGTVAPGWVFYDMAGEKLSLTQMKGKVVLIDFFFIGCFPCMSSLKTLDNLYKKYKDKNFAIVSISFRDSTKNVMAFKKNYNIKYPVFGNAADLGKLYHVTGAPTFYFINKEGKIANAITGYEDDFKKKATSIIDGLLNN